MVRLPACELRHATTNAGVFYCRHCQVQAIGNLVESRECRSCPVRTVPCEDPRPVPGPEPLPVEDLPPVVAPPLLTQVWSVTKAVAAFVADGCQKVDQDTYAARLEVCDGCSRRAGNRCLECGCNLAAKAAGRVFRCPLGKWPDPKPPVSRE